MPENVVLSPPPVFFIKSISEQGYSLSTAVADLIDNSISAGAGRIELLINAGTSPLKVFIADDGHGMSAEELTKNMRFPSADLDERRRELDLGRFGLGLKTASFSQARRFTVISRKTNSEFAGRTWDVEYLKQTEDWTLIIEGKEIIDQHLADLQNASAGFHARKQDFFANTIVIWENLHKLERLKRRSEINDEIDDLRVHLGLVFHRFLQSGKVQIRLNNALIDGFDPFPVNASGVQLISESYWNTLDSFIRFQGIILPKRAMTEAKEPPSPWVPHGQTLDDMQGIFVYRNERLISHGGWLRTIPKAIWLQFGRVKIDVTNINDSEFHLNVAKSSLKLPFGLRRAMAEMITYLASQAAKEYRERMASNVVRNVVLNRGMALILREVNASGPVLRINHEFEVLRKLEGQLNPDQIAMLAIVTGLLENKLNQIWKGDSSNTSDIDEGIDETKKKQILGLKKYYEESGYSQHEIFQFLNESFGQTGNIGSFIDSLK